MEILGSIHDITIVKTVDLENKIKIRVIESEDEKALILDKKELIITKEGKIIIQ